MKINKPKFWDGKINVLSLILFPISLIYLAINLLRKKFYKENTFKIPIICVGNIYLGGTGKTPTSLFLANEILNSGKKTLILRKYYKNHKDEHNLIRKNFNNFILTNNRVDGLKEAENLNYEVVILDDGFQYYSIKKDLNIICFNQKQLIGNGLIVPAGPLRESLSSLKNAHIVIINGNKDKNFENKILAINNKLDIYYSEYNPVNINQFKDKKLFAIAGIGNPENFFQLLRENNLIIKKKLIFPDHYDFSKKEVQNILDHAKEKNYQVIMTEKDYFKIQDYKFDEIKYLKIEFKIDNQKKLLKRINELFN